MNGVYIHIPFCKSKCPYCDFHSDRCNGALQKDYVNALTDEIKSLKRVKEFIPDGTFTADTLYIGGGTPSVLTPQQTEEIILTAKEKFKIPKDGEITVECNPGSDIELLIPSFIKCGVNRISLGLQSAVDSERRLLGRQSNKNRIAQVIGIIKDAGINNISLDIMLGIPNQTEESLNETISFAAEQNIQHISAYILKIEDGTFMDTHRSRYAFPTDDEVCDFYEKCCQHLETAGFNQYEISNFAKPGYESRHNTKYWTLENYLGIGAAAHSFVDGKRFYFDRDTVGFINGNQAVFDCLGNDAEEYIMLRLRLKEGLSLSKLADLYGDCYCKNIMKKAPFLKEQGLVLFNGERLSLTRKGFLVSNSVINELI